MHSVSVSRKGGKLDPSRHGEVEVDEDVDRDESSEYTSVRPRVTARLVAPTPAVIPCGRAADISLLVSCPADHVPDWQPRILLFFFFLSSHL